MDDAAKASSVGTVETREPKPNGATQPYSSLTLTLDQWAARDIPPRQFLLGSVFTTTTRAMLSADTGLGKTHLGFAIAFAIATGEPFCHWSGREPARVLIVDGEMAVETVKERLDDAARRMGLRPPNLFCVCKEDAEGLRPLDTEEGQAWLDGLIEHVSGVDFIIFDNVMALTAGDLKEESDWKPVLDWMLSLTKRRIGCLWINHTGHDSTRAYGTKTREWQLDTVMIGERIDAPGADLAMRVTFTKARQRTPATREDFEPFEMRLEKDEWSTSASTTKRGGKAPSPKGQKFFDAFNETLLASDERHNGWRVVTMDAWRSVCVKRGLIDKDAKPHSARTLFSRYRTELVAADLIRCDGEIAWLTNAELDL